MKNINWIRLYRPQTKTFLWYRLDRPIEKRDLWSWPRDNMPGWNVFDGREDDPPFKLITTSSSRFCEECGNFTPSWQPCSCGHVFKEM